MIYKVKNVREIIENEMGIKLNEDIVFKSKGKTLTFFNVKRPDAYGYGDFQKGTFDDSELESIVRLIRIMITYSN